jgi:glycosyltransferase involved in cell wall biosynthesis
LKINSLSALVITYNETENLPGLLDGLYFAGEIIVVDSFSTDNTIEILKKYPHVSFVQRHFENFSDQRNFALGLAKNKWILFTDADERIPGSLQKEIAHELQNPGDTVAYAVKRQFYFKDKPLRFSGYQSNKAIRLFRKDHGNYDHKKLVHEVPLISGKVKVLKNKLNHYSFKDTISYQKKIDSYARLRAQELYLQGLRPNAFHYYLKPAYRFIRHFLIRLGFLDGKSGFTMSNLEAEGVKKRYQYLKALYRLE